MSAPNKTTLTTAPELLRRDDMASLLQSSRSTIDEMRRRGELPGSIKIGRARFWRRAEVAAWIESRRATSSQEAAAQPASPELLRELQAAHQIIRNALAVMTVEQKEEWGRLNERDGVDGEGVTRANEREAVIAKAGGAT